jgi:hypothetical protein
MMANMATIFAARHVGSSMAQSATMQAAAAVATAAGNGGDWQQYFNSMNVAMRNSQAASTQEMDAMLGLMTAGVAGEGPATGAATGQPVAPAQADNVPAQDEQVADGS